MKKTEFKLDFDDEHYLKCPSCHRMAIIKNLICELDFNINCLIELKDFIESLIEGEIYD